MRKAGVSLLLASFLALTASTFAAASSVETSGPWVTASPYTYWSNPTQGRFYNPHGVLTASELLLFVQGGAYVNVFTGPGSECSHGEQVLLFSAPRTGGGVRSHFTYRGIVSPCERVPGATNVHYTNGSVFKSEWDNQYKLLISETENGATFSEGDFKRVLIGTSSNGYTWSWSAVPFIQQSTVQGQRISVIEVTLVQEPGGGDWWGVFNWGVNHAAQMGQLKVERDPWNVRGFVVKILDENDQWRTVADDGSFDFKPKNIWGNFQRAGSIVFNNGQYELWVSRKVPASQGCPNSDPGDTDGSTFAYRTITKDGYLGPVQGVYSYLRAMPTLNNFGRLFPYRWNAGGGGKYLYSASADRICQEGRDRFPGWHGMEIVATLVNN